MRNLMFSIAAMIGLPLLGPPAAWAGEDRPPELNCEIGPLKKLYGGNPWLVYACSDNRSAVVVSDQGNPAMPFYFIFYVKPTGEMRLYGEGTGAKSATKPAFDELSKLDQSGVAALIAEARAVKVSP